MTKHVVKHFGITNLKDLKHAFTEYLVQFKGPLQLECAEVERDLGVKRLPAEFSTSQIFQSHLNSCLAIKGFLNLFREQSISSCSILFGKFV